MAKSVTVNDRSGWRRRWDDAELLSVRLPGLITAVAQGTPVDTAVAGEQSLTEAQRRFAVHALRQVPGLISQASTSAGVQLNVTKRTPYASDDFEIHSSGIELVHAGSLIHEAVRIRLRAVRGLTLPSGESDDEALDFVAISALVLARAHGAAERIRVSEFSVHTGQYKVLFDGDPAQANAIYLSRGRPVMRALAGADLRPGSQCGSCDMVTVCPAPKKLDGTLALRQRAVALRAISSSDLVAYDKCPTRFHAERRTHLPAHFVHARQREDVEARDRGLAVHALLKAAHAMSRPCSQQVWPVLGDPCASPDSSRLDDLLRSAGVTVLQYASVRPFLLSHIPRSSRRWPNGSGRAASGSLRRRVASTVTRDRCPCASSTSTTGARPAAGLAR